jgi:hypothetical protein
MTKTRHRICKKDLEDKVNWLDYLLLFIHVYGMKRPGLGKEH